MIEISREGSIFLIGFMGAGKTTVGRAVADLLGYDFIDLDQLIESQVGKSVQEIFMELGEPAFRRLEREAIQACGNLNRTVVALGGGAYVQEENRALLREAGKTIWLDCPLEVCLRRIEGDRSRPLLSGKQKMSELLEQRRTSYRLADHAVQSGEATPEEIAREIVRLANE
ncbi:MAG: shikimate kinase [Blastocatellia bacterium]